MNRLATTISILALISAGSAFADQRSLPKQLKTGTGVSSALGYSLNSANGLVGIDSSGNVTITTGTLGVSSNIGAPIFSLNRNAGNYATTYWNTAGVNRWAMFVDNSSESGGNAGSNFGINTYTDAGSYLASPLTINRATGLTTLLSLGVTGGANVSGSLGVGTSSPSFKLEVHGPDSATALISGASHGLRVTEDTSVSYLEGVDNTGVASFQPLFINGSILQFGTGVRSERMRIDASGNVGVGTTNPYNRLTVAGGSVASVGAGSGNGTLSISAGNGSQTAENLLIGVHSGDYSWVQAVAAGTAYRNLALNPQGGQVGINTSSPNQTLDVNGLIRTSGGLEQSGYANPMQIGTRDSQNLQLYTGNSVRMTFDTAGNITASGPFSAPNVVPHVANLAALQAYSPANSTEVDRDSYTSSIAAPTLRYQWQSTCPTGSPDNKALYVASTVVGYSAGCWSAINDDHVGWLTEWGAACDVQIVYTFLTVNLGSAGSRTINLGYNLPSSAVGKTIQVSVGGASASAAWEGTISAVGTNSITVTAGTGTAVSSVNGFIYWGTDDNVAISAAITALQGVRDIVVPARCGTTTGHTINAQAAVVHGTMSPPNQHNYIVPYLPQMSSALVYLGAPGSNILFNQTSVDGASNLTIKQQRVYDLAFYGGNAAAVGRNVATVTNFYSNRLYATDAITGGSNFNWGSHGANNLHEVASTCYGEEHSLTADGILTGAVDFTLTGDTTTQVQGVSKPWNTCRTSFFNILGFFGSADGLFSDMSDHNEFYAPSFIGNGGSTTAYSVHFSAKSSTYYAQANHVHGLSVGNNGSNTQGLIKIEQYANGNSFDYTDNYNPPSGWVPSVASGVIFTCTWDNGSQCIEQTVASLPACSGVFSTNTQGKGIWVSDSNTATFGATVAGGGTNRIYAVCNPNAGVWQVH